MTSPLAETILRLVGGPSNVVSLTHCMSRLRFTLVDEHAADRVGLAGLDDVALVVARAGQLHVGMRRALMPTYDDIAELLR
ncbi:PTS transporter subunit EIIB [Microbacterium sp. 18062]|uniref:PTS transporter subunit EIIB n=1 Tax=Microbacterium sp. 18062 TaxID=2681410 RepID=UPI00135808E0|nr:PTS transporter subunit EIIB [Microbacterium sp. 18062]